MLDLERALVNDELVAQAPAFPGGFAASELLTGTPGVATVPKVQPAYSEGVTAAYVTTDLWVGYDEVWVQPWYYLITAWNAASPMQNRLKLADGKTQAEPVFDVGPRSGFWSPFWQIIYAEVPADANPERYHSAQTLLDDGAPLHVAAPWVYTVRPASVGLGDTGKLLHPYLGKEVAGVSLGAGAWVDGELSPYLNLGGRNFRADSQLVVEEVPLFLFARRDAAGQPQRLPLPAVVGSAPLFSGRPAEIADGRPLYGAFSRVHLAILPATAVPFDPDVHTAGAAALTARQVDPNGYRGRVALDGAPAMAGGASCFDGATFPASCRWLDSQARIEQTLGPSALIRTEVTMTSALVFFDGKGIGR